MVIDVIFLLIGIWGFYQGFSRGIITTVFTVFSIVFGLMAAFKLSPAATRFLETAFHSDHPSLFIAGFLLAFLLTMILIRMVARFLEKTLRSANINFINQLAGGTLLLTLYTLVFSLLVWFGDQAHILTPQNTRDSISYPFLRTFPGKMKQVYVFLEPSFKEFWQETVRFIDRMETSSRQQDGRDKPTIFDIPEEDGR